MKQYKLEMRVMGGEDDIRQFLKFCGMLQYCCNIGASRDLVCSIDGDGSARLGFDVKWGDKDEYEQLKSTKFDTGKNPPTIYIGE